MKISNESDRYSLRHKIFERLEEKILNGEYKPGDYMVETKVSMQYNVSRTPVREAFRQLEREDLVKIVPNKGAMVLGVTPEDIEDIYNIRIVIERLAVRWAIDKITPEEIEQLKQQVELSEFYTDKNNISQLQELDSGFHKIIYDACKSRPLKNVLTYFHHHVKRARRNSFQTPGRAKEALREHREILQAIIDKNSEKAEDLMCTHIRNVKNNLIKNHIIDK